MKVDSMHEKVTWAETKFHGCGLDGPAGRVRVRSLRGESGRDLSNSCACGPGLFQNLRVWAGSGQKFQAEQESSAHPGLHYQKTERETSDTSKSQQNQASWNKTVLKFGSGNKLNVHNYVSIFFVIFSWSHDLEKVTSPSVWLGVRIAPRA